MTDVPVRKQNLQKILYEQSVSLATAFRFLTLLPLRLGCADEQRYYSKSLWYFPVVGLVIGLAGSGLGALCLSFFPQPVSATLLIVYLAGISGCLHLDGLSDSGDGLLSARPRERALAIMRDSHVGAMGVIAVVFLILAKFSALSSIDKELLPQAVCIMPLAGRVAILLTMAVLPYARSQEGLGTLFYSGNVRSASFLGVGIFLFFLLLFTGSSSFFVIIIWGVFFLVFNWSCKVKLGGATGDTLGANCEIAELAVALGFTLF
ncbi:MAG: adenosylcobinamide-GDP ribazoletransferase [Deltaproteobacteria bacterium]|nr:MAG: adenosylcobinamide-GDP ribazoletransferase [Deltaproteobacteria bacterium]